MKPPEILYLDGYRFRRAVLAGARQLIGRQAHLDQINVFPVADSDTGTNMAATMRQVAAQAEGVHTPALHVVCTAVADAALMGARGNSGAILAQFFQGLAEGLAGHRRAGAGVFAAAVAQAGAWARDAVAHPREGTILSVVQAWAAAVEAAGQHTPDFAELLRRTLPAARTALARTPEQLDVLREAGVVDAGAQGFVYLLEGIATLVTTGRLDHEDEVPLPALLEAAHVDLDPDAIRYRYCTECLVSGDGLDRAALREAVDDLGDSIVVAGSSRKVRLHLHTDTPEVAFTRLAAYGVVTARKADDMRQQHVTAFGADAAAGTVAIVTDTGCDLPDALLERHQIYRIPLRVRFGDEEFIDRVTITPDAFYARLATDPNHPKTSQPTPADFRAAYERVLRTHAGALSIHVPGRLSGTLQGAHRAAAQAPGAVDVIDGRSVSVGLGLVVLEAARAAEAGLDAAAVRARVDEALANMRTIFTLETMDYVVRGGRMSRLKGVVARFTRLRPILTFDADGSLQMVDRALFGASARKKVLARVVAEASGLRDLRVAIAHAAAPETAQWYADQIRACLDPVDLFVTEIAPALGVHGGPGAAGIAFIGTPEAQG